MSLTASVPSVRGQCVEHSDYAVCLCSRFIPARQHPDGVFPVLVTSQVHLCTCGHGVHAHVDYVSPVVHHCPSTRCAAYAQMTLQTQDCICGAPLADHVAIVNPYRVPGALLYMPESFVSVQNIGTPSNAGSASPSNMNLVLYYPHPAPSPSHNLYPSETQLPVVTQADVGPYPHLNHTVDADAANGHFYDHSNVMYSATPDAWAGSDA
ncbi:hypothetical protein ARMSODRAFT_1028337 [Armillaria solidipes]|uniref:Uncharacterized protein n=1 Tax=Armillaria solidipes TaxID=1076256 RepID=A0A2H3B5K4_9AGAR|nr:hypothetical protein ARMSODRAFT_1028337 [Armillaria solidipes]